MFYRPKFGRVFGALTAAGLAALGSQNAHAAAFALMEQNASGLGNAYAGQAAAAEDASTIFFNPAGMTYIKGRQAVGAFHLIKPSSEFNDEGSTSPVAPTGGDGGDAGDLAFVPNAYLSWEIVPDKIWLGIGLGAPFGLKTEYDDDWVGRFHAVKSDLKTININPSIAWKVADGVSLGTGINLQNRSGTQQSTSYRGAISALSHCRRRRLELGLESWLNGRSQR
jgi:long-chain fatty acid transport protein